jgi:glycerol-3-phosphate dehydrogenase (NAD(P)+)
MEKVSIVGGGIWGRALAQTFANNSEVILYSLPEAPIDINNSKIKVTYELEALRDSGYLFLVVPCSAVREVCTAIKSIVSSDCQIIICSKGIEPTSGLLMSEVVGEFFPKEQIAVLSGPNFASEILKGLPAITSIVADDISLATSLSNKFSTENFKLIPATNLILAQLFGAMKNAIAILCGVTHGLALGENLAAAVVTKGAKEIMSLADHKNASSNSLTIEPAGLGDLFLTCSSPTSRNHKFGTNLVTKYFGKTHQEIFATEHITVEGVSTILALKKLSIKLPLMAFAYDAISAHYKNKGDLSIALKSAVLYL